MTYTETSLALVEYKLDELRSQRRWIDDRISELVVIRDRIIKERMNELEKLEEL